MYCIVCIAALLHVSLLAWRAARESPVIGETNHLSGGVSHVMLGRFDVFRVNPPLVRTCAAIPVVIAGPATDWKQYDSNPLLRTEGLVGNDFVRANGVRSFELLRLARWGCILFSLLGAWVCFSWARRLWGNASGVLAVVIWCFSPYILGHGSTIIPDAHAAAIGLTAVYCFWRWLRKPDWYEAIVAGAALGLAQLCKFTLLIFYPLLPVLWLAYRFPDRSSLSGVEWLRQIGMLGTLVLASVYFINCGYLFEGTCTPLHEFRFQTCMFSGCHTLDEVPPEGGNRFRGTSFGKLPIPLPANMVQGIDTQRYDFERGLPSYLRGTWQKHGWWYYYLYALAVKVPLGTWCMAVLAVGGTFLSQGCNASWRDEMVVLVPGLILLVFVSSQTGFSVHSRYVIPALPFLFLWTSKVACVIGSRPLAPSRRATAVIAIMALVWSIGGSLWCYPHSLSYFNEVVGGPRNGALHLLDSNIDWGQDLFHLKAWCDQNPDVELDGLAYFGMYPPTLAGFSAFPHPPVAPTCLRGRFSGTPPQRGPKPGWYALSVNHLYDCSGQYSYFRHFRPIAVAGYSIYIYHITPAEADGVRQEFAQPELPGKSAAVYCNRLDHIVRVARGMEDT